MEADTERPVDANPLAQKSVVGFRDLGDKGCDIIPKLIGVRWDLGNVGLEGLFGLAGFGGTGRGLRSISLGITWRFGSSGAFTMFVNDPHANAAMARASAPIVGFTIVIKCSARRF